MKDPNQKMRFTVDELSLMKALFAGTDELMYIIRKVMFQFSLTNVEKEALQKAMTEPVSKLLSKVFLPELDPEAPLFQMTHMVLGLGADIKPLSPEGAWPFIEAKRIEVEYIEQQLKVLNGGNDEPKIVLKDLNSLNYEEHDKELAYVKLTAWNFLASFFDSHLSFIKILAGKKEETTEEMMKRLNKDSAK